MEFRILGPLEVIDGGRALELGGAKQRALLAVLLLHAREVVSSDRLVDELWGDRPPATAAHAIQVLVSNLRKLLDPPGGSREGRRLVTRAPGYLIQVEPEELDLGRFERLVESARRALAGGEAERAADELRRALDLWRGPALADFSYEPFAQTAIARLEELRLAALEERIEADLACGRHATLVGELEAVVREYPLRERLRGQLMLALYRSGRQAEALETFQEARRVLVDELGIDPSPVLQRLERSILQQDRALDLAPRAEPGQSPGATSRHERSILLAPRGADRLDDLVGLAEPLARSAQPHELILAMLAAPDELGAATAVLNERRAALAGKGVAARAVALTDARPAEDLVRLASEQDVDLLLLATSAAELADELPETLAGVLAEAPCDVALVRLGEPAPEPAGVLVPFGGAGHDWAALELGAWFASAAGLPLRLLGMAGDPGGGSRDASRLLAHAALAVQQLAGVVTEPELAQPGAEGLLRAAESARLVVLGLSEGWRQAGLGESRAAVLRSAAPPVLLVRRGLRPGGLAPGASLTRFTWSLAGAG